MNRRRHIRSVVGWLAAAGLVTGCGMAGAPVAGEIDVRRLDVGPYPVDRHRYDQRAEDKGALLEGMRMSAAVVPSVRIDPSLSVGEQGRVIPDSLDATSHFLAGVSKPVLDRHEMIVAYVAAGADQPTAPDADRPGPGATTVTDVVMRFPDADTARTAARELEQVDFDVAPDLNRKLVLPKYPDAFVHYRPGVANIGTFMAYREFVISLFIERPRAEEQDLLAWVQKTLDAQVPALDRFTPTPRDRLDELPVDPEGLLARTLVRDRSGRTPDPNRFGVYAAPAFVQIAADETARQRLVDDTGLDALSVGDTNSVLRVRDTAAGPRLISGLMAAAGSRYDPTAATGEVPGAKCLQLNSTGDLQREPKYRCFVPYKRYVAVVTSNDRTDADQRTAAAYALLANSL
ncbi:hypothetical protein NDR87_19390 [Nocardia sp. CDC159]|uniref:Beta-lactamase family protein n=1 Tax=Nocardia pulmonis TaxID=2951408 RepID=A0A9X2EDB4_9NOCA|nr:MULTISPECIES: hypothetical protein [Nocardia]MCM6776143.1 hypothetical protein [Nocardia pulmonis]MCM6788530.1 hypothetical protein [Nocardia sp. CDC159]